MQRKYVLMGKVILLATLVVAVFAAGVPRPVFAAAPADANCLGKDISSFTKIYHGFVGDIASALASGGFDNEILAHKQGIPGISSCPDNGFPTPLH